MSKSILIFVFILGVALLSPPIAISQEMGKPSEAVKKGKLTTLKGEVTEVDPAGKSVKVKDKDKEVTLDITDKTLVTAGRIKKSIADLREGDKVVVKFSEHDGKATARSIRMASARRESHKGGAGPVPKGAPDAMQNAPGSAAPAPDSGVPDSSAAH